MRGWPAEPKKASNEGALRPETVKHYLETIFYIQFEEDRVRPGRIAEWLGLRPPTVSVTLHRLERDGWINVESDRTVSLTDQGMALASGVVRVHRLAGAMAHRRARLRLGHRRQLRAGDRARHVGRGRRTLDEHLGTRHVPPRERDPGEPRRTASSSLAELTPGVKAHVRRISEVAEHDAPDLLRRLDGHGLVTGSEVVVAADGSSDDAITVDIGDRTMALGISTASLIWVEREASGRRRGGAPPRHPRS